MNDQKTIVLVLRSGGDFSFTDVELISSHILKKWKGEIKPRIICLWDNATTEYNLGNVDVVPLTNRYRGTWSRMMLYSPEMDKYRPFLYMDLDTAVIKSVENIFNLISNPSEFVVLEDFWQGQRRIATPLVWFPAGSSKVSKVWKAWSRNPVSSGFRMDYFLRNNTQADRFWQELTNTIYDFKPHPKIFLTTLPEDANVVCFHGHPRIPEAVGIDWVERYIKEAV